MTLIRRSPWRLLLFFLVAIVASDSARALHAQPSFKLLDQQLLPARFRSSQDVRWKDDQTLLLTAGRAGTFEVDLERLGLKPLAVDPTVGQAEVESGSTASIRRSLTSMRQEIPFDFRTLKPILAGTGMPGGFWFHSRLAYSPEATVIASPALSLYLLANRAAITGGERPQEYTIDVDLHAGRMLLLGAQKILGEFSPNGAIAWEGSIELLSTGLRPVLFSIDGPGARNVNDCGSIELGAVRYLPDGSYVIAPGVQPGVFHYGADGILRHAWDSAQLGFYAGCDLETAEARRISANMPPRQAWVNAHVVLEEILPFADGPGLILRTHRDGETRWKLILLDAKTGEVQPAVELPVVSQSPHSRLRGDVRGERVILLKLEYGGDVPTEPPRLVLLNRQQ